MLPAGKPATVGERSMRKRSAREDPPRMLVDRRRQPIDRGTNAGDLVVAVGKREREILPIDMPPQALKQVPCSRRIATQPIEPGEAGGELGIRLVEGERALVERQAVCEALLLLERLA